jgi:hypothetical protein
MDERVTKCLDTIEEAFKTLITSANNEVELIGLMATVLGEFQETYEKAVSDGIEELEKKEGN